MESISQNNFKYGQKVYSLISLRSGIICDINPNTNKVTIDKGGDLGKETLSTLNITHDVEEILDIFREQVEDYKESFFRVNNTLRKVSGRC